MNDARVSLPGALQKMTFHVEARRLDAHGSMARCKDAEIALDTDPAGKRDAFNPAELLLAALAACIIRGIERVSPILQFALREIEVRVEDVRLDGPPQMESITYEIIVDTDESDHRLESAAQQCEKVWHGLQHLNAGHFAERQAAPEGEADLSKELHVHGPAESHRAFAIGVVMNTLFVAIEAHSGWKVKACELK